MSREAPQPATGWADRLHEVWRRFREGRLYVQVVLSLVMIGISGLVVVAPGAPLVRVRTALRWVAYQDYDFAGQATRANTWARGHGGWGPATAGIWRSGQARVQTWIERTGSSREAAAPADRPPPAAPPAPGAPAWGLPVANGSVLYGYGWLPGAVSTKLHEGIDFAAPVATPVLAVSDGVISRIIADPQLGLTIEATHGTAAVLYAQVTSIRVQKGDQVKQGQLLALVGEPAGGEKGMPPHLHFAVRPAGTQGPVDPAFYLGLGGSTH